MVRSSRRACAWSSTTTSGRIRRYATCDEVELKDGSERELLERFERALPARATVVALEVDGRTFDSAGFARWIGRCEQNAIGTAAFLIGGSYGLPPAVRSAPICDCRSRR